MQNHKNALIQICGGIAAGKTTLASLFSESINPVFEDFKKSPFWEEFYLNPGKYIFETEISFALLHYHQVKKAIEFCGCSLICDFSFLADLAYAKIGLVDTQLNAFKCVLDEIQKELPEPNLYVYLDCDAEAQLERIRYRKRPEENLINIEFLELLNTAIKKELNKIDQKKVLTIDSVENDFANIEMVKNEMTKLVKRKVLNKKVEATTANQSC